MGKYTERRDRALRAKQGRIHPIWAGIGFLMVIIVPLMTWAATVLIVDGVQASNPAMLNGFPRYLAVPAFLYGIPGMAMIARMDNFAIKAVFFIFALVIFTGLFSTLYAFIYRLVGPPRYAPDDIPAPKIKTKPFKR